MRADFLKMHGAGNDFVVFDERVRPLALTPGAIARLADRRRGIGCDQLIRLHPPRDQAARVRMEIRNQDGSEAAACGNATRCVATLLGGDTVIETEAGLLRARRLADGLIEVDMGAPRLEAEAIPLADPTLDTVHLPLDGDPAACSMGNPHATFFVDDLDAIDVAGRGAAIARDTLFPESANIGFAQRLGDAALRLRVWERGAGLTLACGSGACAALVNAHRRGLTGRTARIVLDGGVLDITWRAADGHVLMAGPTSTAFTGSVDLSAFSP